ncbi:MAG: PTS sugar transporter subunit IIA [Thermodesulfobacteriota bacterium]
MVGLLIITHCRLGKELLEAAEFILGSIQNADYVSIDNPQDSATVRKLIEEKIRSLNRGNGVLVLTDMFGGTPSNLALSFLQQGAVEVVTGVNLPMVIAVAQNREQSNLPQIADIAKNAGCRSISLASELLKPNST